MAMKLFSVQDHDRGPAWVLAETYAQAVSRWQNAFAIKNDGNDPGLPDGVSLVCDSSDLILDDNGFQE